MRNALVEDETNEVAACTADYDPSGFAVIYALHFSDLVLRDFHDFPHLVNRSTVLLQM